MNDSIIDDEARFDSANAAGYAAMWGGDPAYDLPPRRRGDGYMFYNYSEEGDDPTFLRKFLGAIARSIKSCEWRPDDHEEHDAEDLRALKDHVTDQLAALTT